MSFCNFSHIVPTKYLFLIDGRPVHLCLAHLVEQDETYAAFYRDQKKKHGSTIIMDNSGFEMYKQNKPMFPTDKLLGLANKIGCDYIVLSDYPGESGSKTIEAAEKTAPIYKNEGFGTFFVPQGDAGDVNDLARSFNYAKDAKDIDYIGISILAAPLAYNCESATYYSSFTPQRFLARWHLMTLLQSNDWFEEAVVDNEKKIHLLGMTDGPNEIKLMAPFRTFIHSWDSSAAVWCGLNGIVFDESPTGLTSGKLEKEVDFNFELEDTQGSLIYNAVANMNYVDNLVKKYL